MKATRLFNTGQTILITFALSLLTLNSQAQLFYDGFESADMSSTNADGFKWGSNNRTSIVTMDSQDGPVAVWNNGSIYNISADQTKDWTAKNGDYCLRFRYPAGQPWAEQRFNLGAYHTEVWIRLWMRVPTNYEHRNGNHKLFDISMGAYGSSNPVFTKVTWEYWPTNVAGNSKVQFSYDYDSNNDGNLSNSGQKQGVPFIDASTDKGKWMQLVFHVKASTLGRSEDGIIEMWRRWETESTFTKLHELTTAILEVQEPDSYGFIEGFILGWANEGFAETTEWLIDDFTLSTTSLIDSIPTRIQEITEAGTINVYPNPTSDHITISDLSPKGKTTVILNNTLGQQVGEVMNFTGKTSVQMNTTHLPEGIYLLTVVTNNQQFTTKIIK